MFLKDFMLADKNRRELAKNIIMAFMFSTVVYFYLEAIFDFLVLSIFLSQILNFIMITLIINNYLGRFLFIDSLTKLPLREKLISDMKKLLIHDNIFYVIFIDINDFKKVNDTRGHRQGDLVLKEFSNSLESIDKDIKTYRYGGDEFVCLLTNNDCTELIDKFKKFSKNRCGNIKFSYGIVEVNKKFYGEFDIEKRVEKIVELADDRMYDNKKKSKK